MFKKTICILLSAVALFSCGCAGKRGGTESSGSSQSKPSFSTVEPAPYKSLKSQTSQKVQWSESNRCNIDGVMSIEYSGADYNGNATKVYAYLGFPENASKQNKVPAVVLVHGGGGTAFPDWVKMWTERGYAAIAMDTEGKRPDGSRDGLGGPSNDYMFTDNLVIEEQWMYQAVSAAVRGATLLLSDERVDKAKLGIVGVSWGSVITSIALGVDNRFAFGVPIYGSGYLDETLSAFGKSAKENAFRLWNPNYYFQYYTAKIFYANSDHDPHFSANITTKSATQLNAPITFIAEHTHSEVTAEHIAEVYAFADSVVFGKNVLARITGYNVKDGKVTASFAMPENIERAELEVYEKKEQLFYNNLGGNYVIDKDFEMADVAYRFDDVNGRLEFNIPWQSKIVYFNIVTEFEGVKYRMSSPLIYLADDALPVKKELELAPEKDWIEADTWGKDLRTAYLQPYWYSREIYNETCVFIGEEGESTLMFTPSEVRSVRDYRLQTTYVEGVDYEITGNKIKRLKGSKMPYWDIEEYFPKEPNFPDIVIEADMNSLDVKLDGKRYILYNEYAFFTDKQVAVTYRHNEAYTGSVPEAQTEKLTGFLNKVKSGRKVNIMVYGDSVATGCNASGTEQGGKINPYMPDAFNIFAEYLTERYNADISIENKAVGGWRLSQCLNDYNNRIAGKNIDLMILRIGGNDQATSEDEYTSQLTMLINKFFNDYPNANLIIQTPELANAQAVPMWRNNVAYIPTWSKGVMEENANKDKIAVADVQAFVTWVEGRGKKTRDMLANNINHGNDFMIRSYAQILLKTLLGSDFVEEVYKK